MLFRSAEDPEEPQEVSLPVVVALYRQVQELQRCVDELLKESHKETKAKEEHEYRTTAGELKNLHKAICKEVNAWVKDDLLDPLDAADIKEGIRTLNQAVLNNWPLPTRAILDVVLNLEQLQLSAPATLDTLYTKFYKPRLTNAAEADVNRVVEIAGVNLYEVDWIDFLRKE